MRRVCARACVLLELFIERDLRAYNKPMIWQPNGKIVEHMHYAQHTLTAHTYRRCRHRHYFIEFCVSNSFALAYARRRILVFFMYKVGRLDYNMRAMPFMFGFG